MSDASSCAEKDLAASRASSNVCQAFPVAQWEDTVVAEMSQLVLLIESDAEYIRKKACHLVESRRCPRDCLRHAERLEDRGTQLRTHARQLIRRAVEQQP